MKVIAADVGDMRVQAGNFRFLFFPVLAEFHRVGQLALPAYSMCIA